MLLRNTTEHEDGGQLSLLAGGTPLFLWQGSHKVPTGNLPDATTVAQGYPSEGEDFHGEALRVPLIAKQK